MDRVEEFALRSFSHGYTIESGLTYRYNNFNDNDVFKYFLVAHLSPSGGEIPIIFNHLDFALYKKEAKIMFPLFANGVEQVRIRRLVATALSDFSGADSDTRLQCVKTNKGDRYYGAPGLILDRDYNPLLVLTVRYKVPPLGSNLLRGTECVCHINKKVFLNQEGLIEKTIYKKILPLYASRVPNNAVVGPWYGTPAGMSIVIDDCSQFIEKPIPPKPSATSDAFINDLIERNLEVLCL